MLTIGNWFFFLLGRQMNYSQHPKSGLSGFIEFNSCPDAEWSDIPMAFKIRTQCPVFKWLA
jgi:hypothetical protein